MMRIKEQIHPGDSASFSKTITESDVVLFAGVSGDFNPAHVDEESAKNGVFGQRVAHGMLSASFISAVLGTRFPGPGTIYLSQQLKFVKPVFIGDTITATVTAVEQISEKNRLKLHTIVTKQDSTVVIDGEAIVIPPRCNNPP